MNKKFKKMLAAVSAVAVCAVSNIPFCASASENPLFDKIINSFEEQDAFIHDRTKTDNDYFIVSENESLLLSKSYSTSITLKEDTNLPIKEINEKIYPAELFKCNMDLTKPNVPISYEIRFNSGIDNQKVIDIISDYDNVLSIDARYVVFSMPERLWNCDAVYFKTDLNCDELFPYYDIIDESDVDFYYWNDNGEMEKLSGYKGIHFSGKEELYSALKTIQDNNIDYKLDLGNCELIPPIYAEETLNLYKKDATITVTAMSLESSEPKVTLSGDANCDEEVTISDTVLIMQTIINPDEFKMTMQGKANADVVGDGDGVTLSDAFEIQEIALRNFAE